MSPGRVLLLRTEVLALVLALPCPAAAQPAKRQPTREELLTQARHYQRKGLPQAAVPFLEDALARPGADGDEALLLAAAGVYRELDRLEDAFDVLGRGRDLPKVARLAERLAERYGPVRFVPTDAQEAAGRIVLVARDLIAVEKKEVYRGIRKRLDEEVEVPLTVYLPYGTFTANDQPFEHRRGETAEVAVPLHRIAVVTEGATELQQGLVDELSSRLGGSYLVLSVAELHRGPSRVAGVAQGRPARGAELARYAPHLVVAVGPSALQWCLLSFPNAPLAYARVPAAQARRLTRRQRHVTGVAQEPSWEVAVGKLRRRVPAAKRVGFVAHPERGRKAFAHAASALRRAGLEPRVVYVRGARQVPAALARLVPDADLLWQLRDEGLWTADNRTRLQEVALQRRIATLVDSEQAVVGGGFAAVVAPDDALAESLAHIVRAVLRVGKRPKAVPVAPPERFSWVVNAGVAARLGIRLPPRVLEGAWRVVGARPAKGRPPPPDRE